MEHVLIVTSISPVQERSALQAVVGSDTRPRSTGNLVQALGLATFARFAWYLKDKTDNNQYLIKAKVAKNDSTNTIFSCSDFQSLDVIPSCPSPPHHHAAGHEGIFAG